MEFLQVTEVHSRALLFFELGGCGSSHSVLLAGHVEAKDSGPQPGEGWLVFQSWAAEVAQQVSVEKSALNLCSVSIKLSIAAEEVVLYNAGLPSHCLPLGLLLEPPVLLL